jgi:hypothetical protein
MSAFYVGPQTHSPRGDRSHGARVAYPMRRRLATYASNAVPKSAIGHPAGAPEVINDPAVIRTGPRHRREIGPRRCKKREGGERELVNHLARLVGHVTVNLFTIVPVRGPRRRPPRRSALCNSVVERGPLVPNLTFGEEYATRFYARYPPVFGRSPWSSDFSLILNLMWIAIWIVAAFGLSAARVDKADRCDGSVVLGVE